MGNSESSSACFKHELFRYRAAADESAGIGFWRDGIAATAAAVYGAEEWIGQVSEFDLVFQAR